MGKKDARKIVMENWVKKIMEYYKNVKIKSTGINRNYL